MLKFANKKLIGIFFLVFSGLIIIQYQNCGPQQASSTGLVLGAKNSSTGTISATPTVILTPPTTSGVIGSSFTFSANVSGGSTPYVYYWNVGSGSGSCPTTSPTCTLSFGAAGVSSVSVSVVDHNNLSASSSSTVTISTSVQPLTVSLAPASTSMQVGVAQAFTANVSGGQAPYTYAWTVTGSQTGCGATATCSVSYSTAATWSVLVSVHDAIGTAMSAAATVTVSGVVTPPACTTTLGNVESATMNSSCYITASGWAWNPNWAQGTQVRVTAYVGSSTVTVSGVRDDVHNAYSCVPASPTGKPGFSTTFYFGTIRDYISSIQLTGYVLNPNGSVAATLNSVDVPINANCVVSVN